MYKVNKIGGSIQVGGQSKFENCSFKIEKLNSN